MCDKREKAKQSDFNVEGTESSVMQGENGKKKKSRMHSMSKACPYSVEEMWDCFLSMVKK